jgi:F1F0 ATPase subunit 2
MNDALPLILAALAGVLLGVIFFGGLFWTVKRGLASRRPAILFLGSFLLRMGIVMAGFYFVGQGDWRRLVACLVGFVIARLIVTGLAAKLEKEASDAP